MMRNITILVITESNCSENTTPIDFYLRLRYNTIIFGADKMMIYTHTRKSKQKLRPKKEREEYEAWLAKHQPTKTIRQESNTLSYKLTTPVGRSTTKHIPSLNTGLAVATAVPQKVYTGNKVLGIATMHKSNAVPIFHAEEAIEISKMRR